MHTLPLHTLSTSVHARSPFTLGTPGAPHLREDPEASSDSAESLPRRCGQSLLRLRRTRRRLPRTPPEPPDRRASQVERLDGGVGVRELVGGPKVGFVVTASQTAKQGTLGENRRTSLSLCTACLVLGGAKASQKQLKLVGVTLLTGLDLTIEPGGNQDKRPPKNVF